MAQAVVSGIVKKMGDLLIQEAAFLYGVSDQIELIKLQLHQMQCFLKDADSAQKKDERVKGWVKDVRDVAYETEDAIDTFLGEIALSQCKGVGIGGLRLFAQKPAELVARHKLGKKISKIQTKLGIISEGRTTFGIENLGQDDRSETRSVIRVAMNPDNDDFEIVGFEDAKTNLIQQLVAAGARSEQSRRRVVSIVGQGSLGKTTLAQKIYNDKTIKGYFDVTLCLTISSDFKIADVLKKAIKKLTGSEVNKDQQNDVQFLFEEMKRVLGNKRYFIVLDDVWTKDFFVLFERAIPDACGGSRVLMTTRSLEVAKLADSSSMPYELRFLNGDESLKLLLRKAFPHQNGTSGCCIGDELVDVAKQITKLCGGLPLALVVVGSLLSVRNPTYDGWNRVLRTINWQSDGIECMEVLAMSYQDLTYPLKLCFLYLACFPEDYEIHKGPLIRMWIAEGFIQHDGRGEMEDEAERYLEELAQRCMVRVTKRNVKCGTIKRFRVHDLLRELAISESKEQKFLEVNPKPNHGVLHTTSRRAAYFQTDQMVITCSSSNNNSNLRSLLIFDVPAPNNQIWFGLLRLLELRNVGTVEKLPAEVTSMVHLRYLGLRGSSVCSLPEKIDRLQNLQTLDIRATPMTSIPVSLWDITALRHVHTDWIRPVNGPPKGCKLESILTLKYTKVMAWEDGLPQLKNIKKLGILNIDNRNPIPTTRLLRSLEHLRNLTVGFGSFGTLPEEIVDMRHFQSYSNIQCLTLAGQWPAQSTPFSAATMPVHIAQLVLHNSRFEQDPMPELMKLKSLRVLYLIYNAVCCNKITCVAGGFPRLKKLRVMVHSSLEEWHVEEGSLPCLRYLYIQECSELRILPDLHHVATLQELEMRSMPKQLLSRLARPSGEDWHKIKHILQLNIDNILHTK